MILLPARLTVHQSALCLDGGTLWFDMRDERGHRHTLSLIQHRSPRRRDDSSVPGRLYFDGELVPIRSPDEAGLLALLRQAEDDNGAFMLDRVRVFVESDEYLRFAERVEQAEDPTTYRAWITWEKLSRSAAIVRLGAFLGIGMSAARERFKNGAPFAESLSALELADLAERLAKEELGLRVEPPFRWPLGRP